MPARILIIEDNQANLDLMSYLLKAFGHTLLSVADGEAGLESARRERPDLIICDVQLPGTDGYGVARQLKSEVALRAIPLVAVTALAMVGDRERLIWPSRSIPKALSSRSILSSRRVCVPFAFRSHPSPSRRLRFPKQPVPPSW